MKSKNESNRSKGGRIPKDDPAVFRYTISFNSVEHDKFLSLFEQSEMKVKAHFITACIFNKPIKVVKLDKYAHDYYMRLTTFFGQFRSVGTNYNQVVKALNTNFTEKKALAFLYKLEKATIELVDIYKQVVELTNEFETKWLKK